MTEPTATPPLVRHGGCLCGQFRFTTFGEAEVAGICHCKDCQRQTGSAYAILAVFDNAAVERQGTLSSFTTVGELGRSVKRLFLSAMRLRRDQRSRVLSRQEPGQMRIVRGHGLGQAGLQPVLRQRAAVAGLARDADHVPADVRSAGRRARLRHHGFTAWARRPQAPFDPKAPSTRSMPWATGSAISSATFPASRNGRGARAARGGQRFVIDFRSKTIGRRRSFPMARGREPPPCRASARPSGCRRASFRPPIPRFTRRSIGAEIA